MIVEVDEYELGGKENGEWNGFDDDEYDLALM